MADLEKIIPYVPRLRTVDPDHPDDRPAADTANKSREWSDLLQLVHEAASLVRDAERRAAEQQTYTDTFMEQAKLELDQARDLLRGAEQRADAADLRAVDLERQILDISRKADDWEVMALDAQAAARTADARCREAEARADAAYGRISAALERANAAEAAAASAEEWLRRIQKALCDEFPRARSR